MAGKDVVDDALFRDEISAADNEVLHVIALNKSSCHAVADAAEHFAELLQVNDVGIRFIQLCELRAGIGYFHDKFTSVDYSGDRR